MKAPKKVQSIHEKLQELLDALGEQKDLLEEKFDSKSDRWKESEAGEEMSSSVSALDEAYSNLEGCIDYIASAFEID